MGNEDQALIVYSRKRRRDNHHHQSKHSHQKYNYVRTNKDLSKLRCYTGDERGCFAINCPMNKSGSKKKKNSKGRHHAHTAKDDDPPRKESKTRK